MEILLLGACELLILKVPPHAAVDAANRLAAADAKAVHFKPLINAVLRRIAREGESVRARLDAARLNTPDWLWERWSAQYGEETARAIAKAHASEAPLDIMLEATPMRRIPRARPLFGLSRRRDGGGPGGRAARIRRRRLVGAGCGGDIAGAAAGRCRGQARDRSLRRAGRQDACSWRRRARR